MQSVRVLDDSQTHRLVYPARPVHRMILSNTLTGLFTQLG